MKKSLYFPIIQRKYVKNYDHHHSEGASHWGGPVQLAFQSLIHEFKIYILYRITNI